MNICFAADRTLGKLAKWLRILGYDTIYESDVSGKWFFEHLGKDRILMTRSEKVQKKFATHKMVFITSNYPVEQLKQVIDEIGINLSDTLPFSRCIHCNLPIVDVNKDDVYGLVPNYIWETHDAFHKCRQCERIYWPGSHTARSTEIIKQLFKSN